MWCRVLLLLLPLLAQGGELQRYLAQPEPDYRWTLYHTQQDFLVSHYFLQLTSQRWLTEQQVDYPLWQHEIKITVPRWETCIGRHRPGRTAILVISGGRNKRGQPPSTEPSSVATPVAEMFCRPMVEVRQIPNQKLLFAGETERRKEDALLAWSMVQYLQGQEGEWPAQMAMVKAVVKAMDAVQAFSASEASLEPIEDFVLFGASKRGWTAWLTAAQDPRVRAIVPISIDMPNLPKQFPHHYASYGFFAPALNDYSRYRMACMMNKARAEALLNIIDPYRYLDRLTLPKLMINSAGDEFFVSDSWRFYFPDLKGPKWLRYTANTDHGQGGDAQRLYYIVQARNWVDAVLGGDMPPTIYARENGDELTVTLSEKASEVRLWTALNPQGRDFRLESLGPVWESETLRAGKREYRIKLKAPKQGYRAWFVEAAFGGPLVINQQVFTTGVYIRPQTLPFAPPSCPAQSSSSK